MSKQTATRSSTAIITITVAAIVLVLAIIGTYLVMRDDTEVTTAAEPTSTETVEPISQEDATPLGGEFDDPDDPLLFTDMLGRPVDPAEMADGGENLTTELQQVSNTDEMFVINAVDLHAPLGSLVSHNGLVEPTSYSGVFIVADYSGGVDNPEDGAVVTATHALDGEGVAPGNVLFDTEHEASLVALGDSIDLLDRTYNVTAAYTMAKEDVPYHEAMWGDIPNMLYIITCVPHSDNNFIIEAQLA